MNKEFEKLCREITEKLDNTAEYESWLIVQDYIDEFIQALNEIRELVNNCSDNLDDIMCYDIDR